MSLQKELEQRSNGTCEICGAKTELSILTVAPKQEQYPEHSAMACSTCKNQFENPETVEPNHWRCLNDSMWSEIPAVKVIAWRMLNRLKSEGWPQDLLDMIYLDDETLAWAKATGEGSDEETVKHVDSNGVILQTGDTVVLIKDLDVKGANFTAKRGTAVRNIKLVHDNPEHIEGRVEGQSIVILTQYVKKS